MSIKREKIIEMALDFKNKMEKENIWFSLDSKTLLGAVRHGGFIPWSIKFEVMINVEGYNKMKRVFSKNLLDSTIDPEFNSLTAAWVADNKNWKTEQPFIQIRVLVPSTVEKVNKYRSLGATLDRVFKNKKDGLRRAIDNLYEPKFFQGFYIINHRRKDEHRNWLQVVSWKTKEMDFVGHKFPVLVEYQEFLENKYGENFLKFKEPKVWSEYPYPLAEVRVE